MKRENRKKTRKPEDFEKIIRLNSFMPLKSPPASRPGNPIRSTEWFKGVTGKKSPGRGMTIDITVETHGNESQFEQFLRNLDEAIHDTAESYGGILYYSEMWKGVSSVTIMLESGKLGELMILIAIMPGVERVEDGKYYVDRLYLPEDYSGFGRYPVNSRPGNILRVIMKHEINLGY